MSSARLRVIGVEIDRREDDGAFVVNLVKRDRDGRETRFNSGEFRSKPEALDWQEELMAEYGVMGSSTARAIGGTNGN